MRLGLRLFAVGAAVFVGLAVVCISFHLNPLLVFFTEPLKPPTPPLLENASAMGGWGGMGCPRTPDSPAPDAMPEARSPEVESRLATQFPAGTPEAGLKSALIAQHFQPIASCETVASIRRATFLQTGGGFYGPYPAWAVVAWKVDAEGKIVWTKADVEYTGP